MENKTGHWVRFDEEGHAAWFGPSWVEGAVWVEGVDFNTLVSCRYVNGEWFLKEVKIVDTPTVVELDPEVVEELRKIEGVEFEGVKCSATKEDQDGLAAVLLAIQLQGPTFKPTLFHFSNGSRLVISLENYQEFIQTWLPFRQSFFQVK